MNKKQTVPSKGGNTASVKKTTKSPPKATTNAPSKGPSTPRGQNSASSKGIPAKGTAGKTVGSNQIAELAAAHHVSEAEVAELKQAFDLFDTDQGGSIDTKELKAAMVSLGFDSKNAIIFQMISDLDQDGSGQLEFNQWVHLMTHRVNNASSREAINKVFPLYDDEKTGYLSVKNLRRVAQQLGENISEEELQQMIDRADTDRDGLVSADEFYTILTRPMKE